MNNWKIVSQIASGFGIVFVAFAALTAFINFQAINIQAEIQRSILPSDYLQVYVLDSMLPFLLFAVLSFVVAAVTMRNARSETDEEEQLPSTQPEPESPAE
ncbi:MAG: hypothetical protein ACBZ72_00455 [Candidatus Bathyarchaeia archaeon]|jgi:hypothetical protein